METLETVNWSIEVEEFFYRVVWKKKPYKMKYATVICKYCWKKYSSNIYDIRSWHTVSCWCFQIKQATERVYKHWLKFHHLYEKTLWWMYRCNNPKTIHYKYYWWRWVKWLLWDIKESIEYLETLDNNDKKNYQMDRIDTNWHYEKWNIRFIPRIENMANLRSNINITYKWETKHISEWARVLWIKYSTIRHRLVRWLTWDELFSKEQKTTRDKYSTLIFDNINWELLSLSEIHKKYNVSINTLRYRYMRWVRWEDLLKPKERKHVDNTTMIK